jgi:hypothetical protein
MQDNWYEAAVDVFEPSNIISVVDWASDSPFAPIPKVPAPPKAASYNIFTWGVNDPSVGGRSMQPENFDALASPLGWHKLPAANDPFTDGRLRAIKAPNDIMSFETTAGNNVRDHYFVLRYCIVIKVSDAPSSFRSLPTRTGTAGMTGGTTTAPAADRTWSSTSRTARRTGTGRAT